ncbi:MAG TPA: ABC transporter substrate-binding protein [Candidatus Sulfotelmatobacter sp.]
MNKKNIGLLVVAALVVVGIAFVLTRDRKSEPSSGTTKITIAQWGQERYLIYLPVYIAQEKGFFKEQGLDVSIVFSGNDDQVFATVARGDAQFGVGDPIFTAISRNRGFDGIVVASIVDRVALWGVTKSDKKYAKATDFADTKIGTFPRPSTTYTLVKEMIDQNKVRGATIVEAAIGNELALLESGNADLVMLLEPAASIAESKGYHVATSFPSLWGPYAFTGLTSTETYRRANPAAVSSMRSAISRALNLAHEKPEEAVAVAQRLFPNLDSRVLQVAVKRMIDDGTIPTNVDVSKEGWLKAVSVRQNMGDLKAGSQYLECVEPR